VYSQTHGSKKGKQMHAANTMFASAERSAPEAIHRDAAILSESTLAAFAIDRVPVFVTVLNQNREIVYANGTLLDFLGMRSPDAVLGRRPGEALDCMHTQDARCGCGTTEFCRECGAVNSILRVQETHTAQETECRITSTAGVAYEFLVKASPYEVAGNAYTLFIMTDIRHEKRRQALEQTFLHGVNNLLTALLGAADCIDTSTLPQQAAHMIRTMKMATGEMAAEVDGYRMLLEAEDGRLVLRMADVVESLELVDELVRVANVVWPSRSVLRASDATAFCLESDRALVFRILYNMVKNAVEATPTGATITVNARQERGLGIFGVHNPGFMPHPTQHQVFQRSFSTKGRGRGLGTYSMKLFGEECLGGRVWFTTSTGAGTTFSLALPLAPAPYTGA
jgi:signal transduction histidine kinase